MQAAGAGAPLLRWVALLGDQAERMKVATEGRGGLSERRARYQPIVREDRSVNDSGRLREWKVSKRQRGNGLGRGRRGRRVTVYRKLLSR